MNTAYIGLGANLNNPQLQIRNAINSLDQRVNIIVCSSLFQSRSILAGQPDYINAVCQIETDFTANTLLTELQSIENEQGRIRVERWGPRVIDLDILLFNNIEIQQPHLTIPHASMLERNFVLQPLLEIAPQLCLPNGTPIQPIANKLGTEGLEKISQTR